MTDAVKPIVGIVMGSNSDWEVMKNAAEMLKAFDIPFEARVVSAHRMPDEMFDYAETARDRGIRVIIAGAGGAAHLPGMIAAKCTIPVCGVPVPSKYLRGQDSLYSIVQMPTPRSTPPRSSPSRTPASPRSSPTSAPPRTPRPAPWNSRSNEEIPSYERQ